MDEQPPTLSWQEDYWRQRALQAEAHASELRIALKKAEERAFHNGQEAGHHKVARLREMDVVDEAYEALQAAVGVLFALPKSAQSKRRSQVLAQCREALSKRSLDYMRTKRRTLGNPGDSPRKIRDSINGFRKD